MGLGMWIAIVGGLLCIVAFVKDSRKTRSAQQRTAASNLVPSFLAVGFDEDLSGRSLQDSERRISSVALEILNEIPGYKYLRPISDSNGRLVFEVMQLRSHTPLMVKTIVDGPRRLWRARSALFNEASILSHLCGTQAPLLSSVSVTTSGRPFIMRESLPGVTLDRVIFQMASEKRRPRYSEVQTLLTSVCYSVSTIHERQVVHGDLKPANILCEGMDPMRCELSFVLADSIRLLDFEAACIVEPGRQSGAAVLSRGTPYFMAPERYAQTRVSKASDVYSVSALASLLLTGRPERPSTSAGPRILPTNLVRVLQKGMHVDIRERHESIESWSVAFNEAFSGINSPFDEVLWPDDGRSMRQEIAKEAVTISLSPPSSVSGLISEPTIDALVSQEFRTANRRTQRLLELVLFENVSLRNASRDLDLEIDTARTELQLFLEGLDSKLRSASLEVQSRQSKEFNDTLRPLPSASKPS